MSAPGARADGPAFPHLAAPFAIRGIPFRNRVFSSGHQTLLARQGRVTDAMIAYHAARARGGAALIVTEAISAHETAYFNEFTPSGFLDECIPGFRRLAEAVHSAGCRLVGQLFHPGAEVAGVLEDGSRPTAWAPSLHQQERYLVMARPMPKTLVRSVIAGYAATASRLVTAGLDGVEVLASHGYLPIQFCDPRTNQRTDEYGGSFENRMRFLEEVHDETRARIGEATLLGLRISADDLAADGFTEPEVLEVLQALDRAGRFDYFNVTVGTSGTVQGAVHIVAPMSFAPAYVAPYAARVKRAVARPVLVTGRFNQPQDAEKALAAGVADMIGMTRAQICDPDLVTKALGGEAEHIRACIACNQACIGHYAMGVPISCIQHPETGRELEYGRLVAAAQPRRVMIVGGGPAGLKAAAVAAARGHRVTLHEKASRLGGQALLAQLLPERAEFGGIVQNLEREARAAGAAIELGVEIGYAQILAADPDVVILATGAVPYAPPHELSGSAHVVDAWSVIRDEARCGSRVVVADWRGDWVGVGIALKLVRAGHHVRLATVANCIGVNLQYYTRDPLIAELDRLGVVATHYARFAGADENTAYFIHASGGHAIELPDTDTVVLCYGHRSEMMLAEQLEDWTGEVHSIGDALAPRTAEEAVLEGLKIAAKI
ncbi:MAG: FAD-dependent oxidoreductase [Gammaproteobacteria bacterium]|nr:FAD-dependent oxidoreductase [Gammaproteobacteria bacterium]